VYQKMRLKGYFKLVISTEKHYKLHIFIFSLLSICLFILTPISFINKVLAAAVCIGVLFRIKKIEFSYKRWYEIVVFLMVNAFLTMAIFGYDLFLSPRPELLLNLEYVTLNNTELINIAGPYLGLIYFGLGFIWVSYVFQSFLDVLKALGKYKDHVCSPSNGSYWKKWLILLAVMFVMFSIWQVAFNPITLYNDSMGYLDGWLTGTFYDFRSPVYSILIYIIATLAPVKPEVLWIAVVTNLVFSSLLATILMYLHKRWIRFRFILPAAVVLPFIPSFGLQTIVIMPDLANGMSMLWFTYVLVRIIDEVILQNAVSKKQKLSFCIQLCISMALTYFFRDNTFLVYLVMTPVLAIVFALKKQIGLLVTVVISVLIVLLIRFPGYSALDVQDGDGRNEQHKYWAAMHDIQATYYGGGRLSEQTITALRKYIPELDNPELVFEPGSMWECRYGFDMRELTMSEFIPMYVDSFLRNPFKMGTSILHRARVFWVIDSKGQITDINFISIYNPSSTDPPHTHTENADLGVSRQPNFLTSIMQMYILGMGLPIPSIFLWRFGIWTTLMIISIMTLILQKRYIWLITYMPVFVYLTTLVLANGWPNHRYGLPVFFIGLFLPLTLLLNSDEDKKENAR